jgi:hypothetical protein
VDPARNFDLAALVAMAAAAAGVAGCIAGLAMRSSRQVLYGFAIERSCRDP